MRYNYCPHQTRQAPLEIQVFESFRMYCICVVSPGLNYEYYDVPLPLPIAGKRRHAPCSQHSGGSTLERQKITGCPFPLDPFLLHILLTYVLESISTFFIWRAKSASSGAAIYF